MTTIPVPVRPADSWTCKIGMIGRVCGRLAKLVAAHPGAGIRVLYLESSRLTTERYEPFTPFEANVPRSYWTRDGEANEADERVARAEEKWAAAVWDHRNRQG